MEPRDADDDEGGHERPFVDDLQDEDGMGEDESDPLASNGSGDEDEVGEAEELFGASVDMLLSESRGRRKKRRRPFGATGQKRRLSEVPPHLSALMGSATIAFMERRFDDAEQILARIIQEAPKAVQPYRTLALLWEERGDLAKSLSYLMFAAHLDKQDRDLWKRCASLSHHVGDLKQAVYCLTVALKGTDWQDAEALRARANIYAEMKEFRKAAENFVKVSRVSPDDLGAVVSIADMYARDSKPEKAEPFLVAALQRVMRSHRPLDVQSRDASSDNVHAFEVLVQRLVEIRFSQDRFEEAAGLLARVQERRALGDSQTTFLQRVMLAICQYRSGSRALAAITFNEFLASPEIIKANPVLMWYVGEACFAAKDHVKTIKAYSAIADHELYRNQPRLFLRRAEAYMQCNQATEAEKDARHVQALFPGHVEASLILSRLAARNTGNVDSLDVDFRQFRHMSTGGAFCADEHAGDPLTGKSASKDGGSKDSVRSRKRQVEAFLRPVAESVLRSADAVWKSKKYTAKDYLRVLAPVLEAALGLEYASLRPDGVSLLGLGSEMDTSISEQRLVASMQELGEDLKSLGQCLLRSMGMSEYVVFLERLADGVVPLLLRDHSEKKNAGPKKASVLELLSSMRLSKMGNESNLKLRVRAVCLRSLYAHGEVERAYDELRVISVMFGTDVRVWWMCSQLDGYISRFNDTASHMRVSAFLRREANRNLQGARALLGRVMAYGTICVRGRRFLSTPRRAMHCFEYVFRRVPAVPSCALSIGVCLLHVARSRKVLSRGHAVLQAFAYMDEYRRLRRKRVEDETENVKAFVENEIDYNIGRAMHDIGIIHMAAEMYTSVLSRAWPCQTNADPQQTRDGPVPLPAWLDVRREAAFNLARIYRNCGSDDLALGLVRKYLVF